MVRIGIVGASGYSGGQLLETLLAHPQVDLRCVTSRQYAGQPVSQVFPRLAMKNDLVFCEPDIERLADECEYVFLALPHGLAAEFARPLFEKGIRVIDLSADFRLRDTSIYEEFYGCAHPAPELIPHAVYGLPELYRDAIREAKIVACAGCYVTSVLLPLVPLLKAGLLDTSSLRIASMSGVSGAGRKASIDYLFVECNENLRAYKPVRHRHVCEMEQELRVAAQSNDLKISFVPHLVPVNRGIHSTIFAMPANPSVGVTDVLTTLSRAYDTSPFVKVLPSGSLPQTAAVVHTNCCQIAAVQDDRTGSLILFSVIDNLGKGAATQAVQCLNIMLNRPENEGV
ncbi:MAG: N-acetyl-gamma-glutamyl-phosphate reductase [Lentisphaerae bacterium]|nr:MAG: N-acetyl-gamma-glutamyl-phosphate reductase [Lentisphaerota bacterium]